MNNMISAVVLTKNEEKSIERCLTSLAFCDEILIIDDGSTDKTVELAKQHNAVILEHDLASDFAAQRNYGMQKATNRWILFIDADEEVTPALARELKNPDEGVDAYYLRRRDFFWGKELKHGETAKVRNKGILRFMKKNSGTWLSPVHEEFHSNGSTDRMNGFINHYPHQTIKEFLSDINDYTSARAHELQEQRKKVSVSQIVLFPLGKFLYTYFLRMGFLDGPAGFAYSFFMSFHSFLVRAKLYQYLHFHEKSS
jgi:glycosyltransferase involved in cell wall biosynthesis